MKKIEKETISEYEKRKAIACGFASALFEKYILSDEKRFSEFLDIVSDEDKKKILKIFLVPKCPDTITEIMEFFGVKNKQVLDS